MGKWKILIAVLILAALLIYPFRERIGQWICGGEPTGCAPPCQSTAALETAE